MQYCSKVLADRWLEQKGFIANLSLVTALSYFFSFYLMPTCGFKVSLSQTLGYNILFAEPSSMWCEYRNVVSVALAIMVFVVPCSPVFLVSAGLDSSVW